ncbi:MAG: CNNM domain-containing protein [Vicingaceae bacterium]
MTLLLLFLALSIGVSFLCSILEAVLLSITPSFIRKQEKGKPNLFNDLNQFKEDIDRPLSAILTLNTIAHTVGAIGVGVQANNVFGETTIDFYLFTLSAESIIATFMTLAILILSEIIPKTLGANNWQKLAPFAVTSLKIMIRVLTPLVWLSQRITKGMKNEKNKSVLSRSDLAAMTRAVSEDGDINPSESLLIRNVLNLPNKSIEDIMTPRKVMFSALENETLEEVYNQKRFSQFSRIPIFDKEKEAVIGMVLKSDLLSQLILGHKEMTVVELKREVKSINEKELLGEFFKNRHKKREHLYIVEDQYKSVTGLVTLEDVLETILGYEILDETDQVADLQSLINKGK